MVMPPSRLPRIWRPDRCAKDLRHLQRRRPARLQSSHALEAMSDFATYVSCDDALRPSEADFVEIQAATAGRYDERRQRWHGGQSPRAERRARQPRNSLGCAEGGVADRVEGIRLPREYRFAREPLVRWRLFAYPWPGHENSVGRTRMVSPFAPARSKSRCEFRTVSARYSSLPEAAAPEQLPHTSQSCRIRCAVRRRYHRYGRSSRAVQVSARRYIGIILPPGPRR